MVGTGRHGERHLTGQTPVAVLQRHHSVRSHVGDGEWSWAQQQKQLTAYDQRTVLVRADDCLLEVRRATHRRYTTRYCSSGSGRP